METLQNQYQEVLKFVKARKKGYDQVLDLLLKRVNAELQYSKGIEQIATSPLTLDEGTLVFGLQAMQVDCFHRAEQSRIFAENIENEVLEPLRILFKEQNSLTDSYIGKSNELYKGVQDSTDFYQKTKNLYERAHKEVEEILYSCEENRKKNVGGTTKLNEKMTIALKEHKDAAEVYKEAGEKVKHTADNYIKTVQSIIESLKQQEIKKTELIKDALQKIFNYQDIMEQGHTQDSKHAASHIIEIHPESDIKELWDVEVDKLKSEGTVKLKESPWDRLFEVYDAAYYGTDANVLDYEKLVEETKVHILQEEDAEYKEYKAEFDDLYTKMVEGGSVEITEKCKAGMEKYKGRVACLDSLANFIERKEFGKIKECEQIFNVFLEASYKVDEYEGIYKCIKLAKMVNVGQHQSMLALIRGNQAVQDYKVWDYVFTKEVEPHIHANKGSIFETIVNTVKLMKEVGLDREGIRKLVMGKTNNLTVTQIDTINTLIDTEQVAIKEDKLESVHLTEMPEKLPVPVVKEESKGAQEKKVTKQPTLIDTEQTAIKEYKSESVHVTKMPEQPVVKEENKGAEEKKVVKQYVLKRKTNELIRPKPAELRKYDKKEQAKTSLKYSSTMK